MTIPDYQTLMRPILVLLADGSVWRARRIKEAMADEFALTDTERGQTLPSGRQRTINNRVGWSLTYLVQAGLIARPTRGFAQITDAGRSALASNPSRIDAAVLEQYPMFQEFKERSRGATQASPGRDFSNTAAPTDIVELTSTPNDLMERAVIVNRAAVEAEVLAEALKVSPTSFEDLVIRLLERMGYGRAGAVERTSASGDAGIDGIISQDPLGLDRIYVQAKRYAEDRAVDRPRIHEFAGALLGKQGDRGVFITTSRFTSGAQIEADRINARIELIDGKRLAQLLVRYEVGVQVEQTAILYRIDDDFFESI